VHRRDEAPTLMSELKIAMVGTRGVPARYGGFETAIEEVGSCGDRIELKSLVGIKLEFHGVIRS
jgi:hypothetical protein